MKCASLSLCWVFPYESEAATTSPCSENGNQKPWRSFNRGHLGKSRHRSVITPLLNFIDPPDCLKRKAFLLINLKPLIISSEELPAGCKTSMALHSPTFSPVPFSALSLPHIACYWQSFLQCFWRPTITLVLLWCFHPGLQFFHSLATVGTSPWLSLCPPFPLLSFVVSSHQRWCQLLEEALSIQRWAKCGT